MADKEKTYRRTDAGRRVFETGDLSIPSDYRRILSLLDVDTHFNVICGYMRQYPNELLAEWLGELEELGFIEAVPAIAADSLELAAHFAADAGSRLTVMENDAPRIERDAEAAGAMLSRTGVYVAEDRLRHRMPPKEREDTAVLVVEDDPDQLALADLRVSMAGYQVRVARSVEELIVSLRDNGPPDIVLLDVMLPDGDGFEVLEKMRRHPWLALLPVVMLTAKDDVADIAKGLVLGADAYVTKPYSKNVIADTIRRVLKHPASR